MMKPDPKTMFSKAVSRIQEGANEFSDRAIDATDKAREAAGETARKALDAANELSKQASEVAEAGKQQWLIARYNPVFPDQYVAFGNDRPKMIVIEDEDDRKDIEVCEGAIGWLGRSAGTEVLHLYEEDVPFSGIEFNPPAEYGAVYYANKLVPNRYISMDCYFDVIQRDKFTELRRIAYELGAKKCVLESYEEAKVARAASAGVGRKGKGIAFLKEEPAMRGPSDNGGSDGKGAKPVRTAFSDGESIDVSVQYRRDTKKRVLFTQTFEGNASPKRPELKWFANDEEIKFLIETRCNDASDNKTKHYSFQLDSSSSQTMNVALAAKLDKALGKLCSTYNFSLEGEAKAEARRKLNFIVEF